MQNITDLKILEKEVVEYLSQKGFANNSVYKFKLACRDLELFMKSSDINEYSADVYDRYIKHLTNNTGQNNLSLWEKELIRWAGRINEYHLTGSILFFKKREYTFSHAFEKEFTAFIKSKQDDGLAKKTINDYSYHLLFFDAFINDAGICSLSELTQNHILKYSRNILLKDAFEFPKNFSILRRFLKYAYQQKWILTDLTSSVPIPKRNKQPKLPSIYSREEIERLLSSVGRKSPKGKRDYAMILLAARLGLRASDICALTFENLCWEKSLIFLRQIKTGRKAELPILADIGEAIIDYLKYGRPETDLPYVFIQSKAPYGKMTFSSVHRIITTYLKHAGIKFENERKHGAHALRHSLVNSLLKNKTPIPVISEILGHSSSESTKAYMRIDVAELRSCALEVPLIENDFYERVAAYEGV